MKNFMVCALVAVFSAWLAGCGGTEVNDNPGPITWGGIKFQPKRTEKSSSLEVWNDVTFNGPKGDGKIAKVTITPKETTLENLQLPPFFSATKVVFANVEGFQRGPDPFLGDSQKIGKFSITDAKLSANDTTGTLASLDMSDISFAHSGLTKLSLANPGRNRIPFDHIGKTKINDFIFDKDGNDEVRIGSVSFDEIANLQDQLEKNLANATVRGLVINDIQITRFNASVKKFSLNFEKGEFETAVNDIFVPGENLALVGIANPPKALEGSVDASGKVQGARLDVRGDLDLKNLLDFKFDMNATTYMLPMSESLSFSLKDNGALKYLDQQTRMNLAMMGIAFPRASQAINSFLSNPGQTIKGKMVVTGRGVDLQCTTN